MGGTTAKACLVEHGEPTLTTSFEVARIYRFKKGSGFPVSVPSIDLVEIGAGGGSIAHTDQFGLLKVGPESAGAEPGPAVVRPWRHAAGGHRCRRRARIARSGRLPRRRHAPRRRRRRRRQSDTVGDRLGLTTVQAAAGIHEIVNQNMAAAARMHAVEHGRRPARRRRAGVRRRRAGPRLRRRRAARLRPGRLPGQRQCAVGVRHAGLAGSHRPRPLDAAPPRRDRRRRARCDARRAAQRGTPRPRRRRSVAATPCASATGSTPATPARATRSPCWIGEGRGLAGRRRRRHDRLRGRVPADLRDDDPRRRRRGGHLAAVGHRRHRPRRASTRRHRLRGRAVHPSPGRVRTQRATRSTRRSTAATTSAPGRRSTDRRSSRNARRQR